MFCSFGESWWSTFEVLHHLTQIQISARSPSPHASIGNFQNLTGCNSKAFAFFSLYCHWYIQLQKERLDPLQIAVVFNFHLSKTNQRQLFKPYVSSMRGWLLCGESSLIFCEGWMTVWQYTPIHSASQIKCSQQQPWDTFTRSPAPSRRGERATRPPWQRERERKRKTEKEWDVEVFCDLGCGGWGVMSVLVLRILDPLLTAPLLQEVYAFVSTAYTQTRTPRAQRALPSYGTTHIESPFSPAHHIYTEFSHRFSSHLYSYLSQRQKFNAQGTAWS